MEKTEYGSTQFVDQEEKQNCINGIYSPKFDQVLT